MISHHSNQSLDKTVKDFESKVIVEEIKVNRFQDHHHQAHLESHVRAGGNKSAIIGYSRNERQPHSCIHCDILAILVEVP